MIEGNPAMSTRRQSLPFPLPVLLLNAVGALMIGAGMVGLVAPEVVPALARPSVAYALLGVGVVLDAAGMVSIVRAVKNLRGP